MSRTPHRPLGMARSSVQQDPRALSDQWRCSSALHHQRTGRPLSYQVLSSSTSVAQRQLRQDQVRVSVSMRPLLQFDNGHFSVQVYFSPLPPAPVSSLRFLLAVGFKFLNCRETVGIALNVSSTLQFFLLKNYHS